MSCRIGLPPIRSFKNADVKTEDCFMELRLLPLEAKELQTNNVTLVDLDVISAESQYNATLKNFGIPKSIISPPLYLYVQSEGPVTETFENSLGESELQKLIQSYDYGTLTTVRNVASYARQVGGTKNLDIIKKAMQYVGGKLHDLAKTTSDPNTQQDAGDAGKKLQTTAANISMGALKALSYASNNNILQYVVSAFMGNRFDFAKQWNGSSCSMNYSFSVKLYNPSPKNDDMHLHHIVYPLISLMVLALPRASDSEFSALATSISKTFDFSGLPNFKDIKKSLNELPKSNLLSRGYFMPFYVRCECDGLFDVNVGMITNLSIIKGGDDNIIAYNNRPCVVDVRFTVESLHGIRIIDSGTDDKDNSAKTAPDNSLKHYKDILASEKNDRDNGKEMFGLTQSERRLTRSAVASTGNGLRDGLSSKINQPAPSATKNTASPISNANTNTPLTGNAISKNKAMSLLKRFGGDISNFQNLLNQDILKLFMLPSNNKLLPVIFGSSDNAFKVLQNGNVIAQTASYVANLAGQLRNVKETVISTRSKYNLLQNNVESSIKNQLNQYENVIKSYDDIYDRITDRSKNGKLW